MDRLDKGIDELLGCIGILLDQRYFGRRGQRIFLLACTLTIVPTLQVLPTDTVGAPAGSTATSTGEPTATLTTAPPAGPAPVVVPASSNYIDDRSTPSQVIVSLYNAISRHEYVRAYSYWGDPAGSLGPYDAYAAGYSDTASVDLVFGQIYGDPGMSQVRTRRDVGRGVGCGDVRLVRWPVEPKREDDESGGRGAARRGQFPGRVQQPRGRRL